MKITVFRKIIIAALILAAGAVAAAQTWDCGPERNRKAVTATLSGGTLRVRGTGPMGDYGQDADISRRLNPWSGSADSITNAVIESGVTSVGYGAFAGCAALTSVTIPNSVTSVGIKAFANSGLTSITIPGSVASIGNMAFAGCAGLKSVVIPDSVRSVADGAFWRCAGLTSVTISASVVRIGYMAFAGCTGLTSVITLNQAPLALGQLAFDGIDTAKACLYVPPGSVDAYRAAAGWNVFRRIKDSAPPVANPPGGVTAASDKPPQGGPVTPTVVRVDMVLIQGGLFTMGCAPGQSDCAQTETPARSVRLGDYYIGKYEVTQGLWKAVMGSNPSNFTGNDNLPVEQVSWDDIQEFIVKLNTKTKQKYRLPTEAEWEYAARGGNISRGYAYPGSNNINEVAWYNGNSGRQTHPVGVKQPNELGLHDMAGNVLEWVSDFYGSYPSFDEVNPQGPPTGSDRAVRGGGWGDEAKYCRVSLRHNNSPDVRRSFLGFRLVLPPP